MRHKVILDPAFRRMDEMDDLEAMARGLPPWHMQAAEPEIVARLP